MSLDELMDHAEEHAPQVQLAEHRVGVAKSSVTGAEKLLPFNPELEGEVGLRTSDASPAKLEVTLRQRLEVAGERGLRISAAHRETQLAEARLALARWNLHQRVHHLYRTSLIDQERVIIEREIVEFTRQLADITAQRYEAGEEPRTSVILARAETARARQRLVKTRTHYREKLHQLAKAVGWDQEKPPRPTGERRAAREIPSNAALLRRALEHDPHTTVLETQLAQRQAQRALATRDAWPNPIVGIGFEREELSSPDAASKIRLILGVQLPIWNRNQGEISGSSARIALVQQAISNRRAILRSRVHEQATSVRGAYQQARIYQEEVLPALETQLELLREGFELGEMSLLDVMNARDRLLAVQRQHLDALETYMIALSELEGLLGASIWESHED
ncbi:MAG: TolC family protein [Myxococcota bacterium]